MGDNECIADTGIKLIIHVHGCECEHTLFYEAVMNGLLLFFSQT